MSTTDGGQIPTSGTHFIARVFFTADRAALDPSAMSSLPDSLRPSNNSSRTMALPGVIVRCPTMSTGRKFIATALHRLANECLSDMNVALPHSEAAALDYRPRSAMQVEAHSPPQQPASSEADSSTLTRFYPPSPFLEDYTAYVGLPDGSGIDPQHAEALDPSQLILQNKSVSFPYVFVLEGHLPKRASLTSLKVGRPSSATSSSGLTLNQPARTTMPLIVKLRDELPRYHRRLQQWTTDIPSNTGSNGVMDGTDGGGALLLSTSGVDQHLKRSSAGSFRGMRRPTQPEQQDQQGTMPMMVADDASIMASVGLTSYDVGIFGTGKYAAAMKSRCQTTGDAIRQVDLSHRRDEHVTLQSAKIKNAELSRTKECEERTRSLLREKQLQAEKMEQREQRTSMEEARSASDYEIAKAQRANNQRLEDEARRKKEKAEASASLGGLRSEQTRRAQEWRSAVENKQTSSSSDLERSLALRLAEREERRKIAQSRTIVRNGPLIAALHSDCDQKDREGERAFRIQQSMSSLVTDLEHSCQEEERLAEVELIKARDARSLRALARQDEDFVKVEEHRKDDRRRIHRNQRHREIKRTQLMNSLAAQGQSVLSA